eukprot:g8749.t1
MVLTVNHVVQGSTQWARRLTGRERPAIIGIRGGRMDCIGLTDVRAGLAGLAMSARGSSLVWLWSTMAQT